MHTQKKEYIASIAGIKSPLKICKEVGTVLCVEFLYIKHFSVYLKGLFLDADIDWEFLDGGLVKVIDLRFQRSCLGMS